MRHIKIHRIKLFQSKGDTLVEVLIALAIISTLLSGAFVVTHDSKVAVHDTSEHQAATALAQSQLEKLKNQASNTPDAIFADGSSFCMNYSGTVDAASDAGCKVDSKGVPTTDQPVYTQSITYDSSSSIFKIIVSWPRAGRGTDQVQLSYRLYAPTVASGGSPSGSADFGDPPPYVCDTDCGDGGGDPGPPPPPDYFWHFGYQNHTDPSEAPLITGCEWDWGDGSPPTVNDACMPNDEIEHDFLPPPGFNPTYDPSVCYTINYTITLTIHLVNGASPTKSNVETLPGCPG